MFNLKDGLAIPFAGSFRAKRHEERMNRKNIKLIKEFLSKQKKQQADNIRELAYLKQQRKTRSLDKATYERLRKVLILSHEMKQLEMLYSVTSKSEKKKN